MPTALASVVLLASALPATAPDYVLIAGRPGAPQTVFHHGGRFRSDEPRPNGDIASDYIAPGRRQQLVVVRGPAGDPTMVFVGQDQAPPLAADDAGWIATGESRALAGERCTLYRPSAVSRPRTARCVTSDGIDLIFRGERVVEAQEVRRVPVSERDVAPPLSLLSLSAWAPPGTGSRGPAARTEGDYTVSFGAGATLRSVRRSGDWTAYESAQPDTRTVVVNDVLGLQVMTSQDPKGGLLIGRFAPGQRFGGFRFKPARVNAQSEQMIAGERCSWFERPTTPDYAEFECRTADGAVLAHGGRGAGGESIAQAVHFKRGPVDPRTVLPPAECFDPRRYGLK